ncbi:MAG TPA: hypothetical protein VL995_00100 [Cellvibrio sp.]|nr:hypothetical protein [Cellvibrio sp.]
MPNTDINDLDAYIDRYVRKKLSAEEELDFEASFLNQPEVIARVEAAQRLKDTLQEMRENEQAKPDIRPPFRANIFRYLMVPQTGWGALAGALIVLPAAFFINGQAKEMDVSATAVYTVKPQSTRSSVDIEKTTCDITIEKDQQSIVIGFEVMPRMGEPIAWSIEISDKDNQRILHKDALKPDFQSVIYLNVTTSLLKNALYTHHLQSANGETIEGKILICRK